MRKFLDKIICGDCIEILNQVRKPFVDLIFADPPFNIGYKYDKYIDNVDCDEYLEWTKNWMAACKKVLKPTGSFYIAIGDEYAADIKIIAEKHLKLFMRNWIIWHYTFGQQTKTKFARSHTHIFYFTKDKKDFTFNDNTIRIPSDRQLIYNDRRAHSKGKIPDDVWDRYSRVCGTFKERLGWHPCQMPESLLMRIISVSSNPDDCVLDPFSGSGTTLVAAKRLGRKYTGIDISKQYVENAAKRLEMLKKRGKKSNLFFDSLELTILKQLIIDMNISVNQLKQGKKLLELFTNQFSIRMGEDRQYDSDRILTALQELTD